MKFDLTKQSLLANVLYIALLCTIFFGGWLLMPGILVSAPGIGVPIGHFIDTFMQDNLLLGVTISLLLLFFNSIVVTKICVKNIIFLEHNYMPALIYVIVSTAYFTAQLNLRPLLASLLLLLAVNQMLRSYNVKRLATGIYLKVGFYFGLAASIYEPAIFLLPLVFIAPAMFRFFNPKEWLAALTGLILPLFFSAYVEWLIGGTFEGYYHGFVAAIMASDTHMPSSVGQVSWLQWVFLSLLILLVVLSIFKFTASRAPHQIKAFKGYIFLVWIFVALIVMMVYLPCRSPGILSLLAIPITILVSTYFNTCRPTLFTNFLYVMLLGCGILMHVIMLLQYNL